MDAHPRILLVDDENTSRLALTSLLTDEGYEVSAAVDGLEAWDTLQTFHPDIVLTDVRMPRLDGIGLLRKIREHSPEMPVVLMTGLSESALTAASLEAAQRVYPITKPIELEELLAVLRRIATPAG